MRLPLQSGASVLSLVVIGAACAGAAALCATIMAVVIAAPGAGSVAVGVFMSIVGTLTFGAVAYMCLGRAARRRASDLLIEGPEIRIEGGPHHGVSFSPAEFDAYAARTVEIEDEYHQSGENGPRIHARTLRISFRDRDDLDLATTWEVEERIALGSIAATLNAMIPGATTAPVDGPPEVARCASCGAPLPAIDRDVVPCPYCGVAGALPDHLRAHVRDAVTLARHRQDTTRAVEALLEQPSARRMNAALLITLLILAATIPIGYAAGPIAAIGLVVLGIAVTHRMINERRAYRIVSCDLASTGDGRERRCRVCQAPLPDVDQLLARCIFCAADNIVAYDLRRALDHAANAPMSIDDVLSRAARARTQFTLISVFAVLWIVGGIAFRILV